MQDVLEFILKNLTTVPDDVKVEAQEEAGVTNYIITVNPDDVGRIIGKEGKVIKAIRTIMRVIAIQKGVRVRVSVLSDGGEGSPDQDAVTIEETPEETPDEATEEVAEPTESTPETPEAEPAAEDSLTVEV